ncbi:MAG: Uma2 family endonuclease [Thiohalocapsa sp.]|nr:Uma2 family endonuclease [Thiohalocapsa sp.]
MSYQGRQRASYQDVLSLPDNLIGEILDNELHIHPRPTPREARACSTLAGTLGANLSVAYESPPQDLQAAYNASQRDDGDAAGWWLFDGPELHLGTDVLVPDLAAWRQARFPALPGATWFDEPPDWICEILSPSTARTDRAIKMAIYAREQVPHLWLIDPDARTLEIYALHDALRWLLLATLKENDATRQSPFDSIEFALGDLWT